KKQIPPLRCGMTNKRLRSGKQKTLRSDKQKATEWQTKDRQRQKQRLMVRAVFLPPIADETAMDGAPGSSCVGINSPAQAHLALDKSKM
ncbi:MAG: hypothetical protein P4K80_01125, partial [Acidobacteriaceae bacterium]|nr:hypothetical protein [Acidobacteriaceae bacterium]